MSDEPTEGVLGSLPRTRPHRRSAKRGPAAEPATTQATPVVATATSRAEATPAATKAKARATPATKAKASTKAKATPATRANAKATPATRAKAKAMPATKAKPKRSSRRGSTDAISAPVRSLQSATAPRAAGDRSRKPGVTSQAHHQGTARPSQPPVTRRSAPPAAEPAGAVGTAVQAAAELTEIGLKASARALRGALSRLPRP